MSEGHGPEQHGIPPHSGGHKQTHGSGGHGGNDHDKDGHDDADYHAGVPEATSFGGLSKEQLLLMFGFVKEEKEVEFKKRFKHLSETKRRAAIKKFSRKEVKDWVKQERAEVADEGFAETGFPGDCAKYHLVLESATENVEDHYYEILERTRQHSGFPYVYKVTDYFGASENSAFFGNSQQRMGIQQDRVQQFLANIGKFVKELFQMVRELRIIDERLEIYHAAGGLPHVDSAHASNGHGRRSSDHKNGHNEGSYGGRGNHGSDRGDWGGHGSDPAGGAHRSPAADVTLKSIFTDLVEGGTKNPQSVFGLATQVNFTLLPDLFFNTYIGDKNDVDRIVDNMSYNKSLKAVLKRKIYQYLVWKEKTYQELVYRRRFNVKYLRQHWTIIKMYMQWVKPYLRNIQRLTMNPEYMESPDIIAAFESSYIEVEYVAFKPPINGFQPVIVTTFYFRTRADMSVRKEYQQGPNHLGRLDFSLRAYAWKPAELQAYRAMKKREEIELLGILDSSLMDIMEALGDDFEKYLAEAGEEIVEDEGTPPPKPRQLGALAPFAAVFGGVKDIFEAFIPVDLFKKDDHGHHGHEDPEIAYTVASELAGRIYHTYKKHHKMMTW